MKVLWVCLFLVACDGTACLNGKTAYRNGDHWVIPDGAYTCIPAKEK